MQYFQSENPQELVEHLSDTGCYFMWLLFNEKNRRFAVQFKTGRFRQNKEEMIDSFADDLSIKILDLLADQDTVRAIKKKSIDFTSSSEFKDKTSEGKGIFVLSKEDKDLVIKLFNCFGFINHFPQYVNFASVFSIELTK